MLTKSDLQFPKLYQIVKSEKYETFLCLQAFNLAPKMGRRVRHGNSLVFRRLSPGSMIVV